MNGAEKIINAMKKVNQSNLPKQSEIGSLTVYSKNPLTFQLENRLKITPEFYELSNIENWNKLEVGDTVRAFSFNEGQKYYITEKVPLNSKINSAGMDERIDNNKIRIDTLVGKVNAVTTTVTNITTGDVILPSDTLTSDENKIGLWVDNKPIYRDIISCNLGTLSTSWQTLTNLPANFKQLVDLRAVNDFSQTSKNRLYPRYENSNWFVAFDVDSTNSTINVMGKGYDNSDIYLIVEYTKTTD